MAFYQHLLHQSRQQAAPVPGRITPYSARTSNALSSQKTMDRNAVSPRMDTPRYLDERPVDPYSVWVSAPHWMTEGELRSFLWDNLPVYGNIVDVATRKGDYFTSGTVTFRSSSILSGGTRTRNLYHDDACISLTLYRPRAPIGSRASHQASMVAAASDTTPPQPSERPYRPLPNRPSREIPQAQAVSSLLRAHKSTNESFYQKQNSLSRSPTNARPTVLASRGASYHSQYTPTASRTIESNCASSQNPLKRKPEKDSCVLQYASSEKRIRAEVERNRKETRYYDDKIPETQANSPPSFSRSRSTTANRSSSPDDDLLKTPPLPAFSGRRTKTPEGRHAFVSAKEDIRMKEGYIKLPYVSERTIDPVLLSLPPKDESTQKPPQVHREERALKTPSTATNSYYSTEGMSQQDSEDEFFTPAPFELREQISVGDLLEEVGARLRAWAEQGLEVGQLYAWEEEVDLEEGECEEIELQ